MNADASWPLQMALIKTLENSPRLKVLMGTGFRVKDAGSGCDIYPCLVLIRSRTRGWRSHSFDGQEHVIRFEVRNAEGGSEMARKIANAIIGELHDADFPIAGHALVDLQFEYSETRYLEASSMFETLMEFKGLTVSD